MMRPSEAVSEVHLCQEPVDFRKGMPGLAALVEGSLGLSPLSGGLFVFINRRRTGIKLLYWDRNGFSMWQKRLERERFHWLKNPEKAVTAITVQQLNWLLDGYDIARMKPHKKLKYAFVS